MNKTGYETLSSVVDASNQALSPEEFLKKSNECVVIDTRDILSAMKGFVKGSYIISLKLTYAIWTATLFKPSEKILLVTDQGKEKESIIRLARVGYQNVIGYLEGGFPAFADYCTKAEKNEEISIIDTFDWANVKEQLTKFVNEGIKIIDVREKGEWENGIVEGAQLFNLSDFQENIEEISKLGKDSKIAVYCKTGGRATLAASILKRSGFSNVINAGGVLNMVEKNVVLTPFKK
jgi:rhodanese-related sulfurtransferase